MLKQWKQMYGGVKLQRTGKDGGEFIRRDVLLTAETRKKKKIKYAALFNYFAVN